MNIRVVIPIRNFATEDEYNICLEDIQLRKGADIYEHLLSQPNFVKNVGLLTMSVIQTNYVWHFEGDANSISFLKNCKNAAEILETLHSYVNNIIDTLWFSKDNNSFIESGFLEHLDSGQMGAIIVPNIKSASQIDYTTTIFNKEELEDFMQKFLKLNEVKKTSNQPKSFPNNSRNHNSVNKIATNHNPYNHHRFNRAILFLNSTRTSQTFHEKITYFMALYESLFTSDDHNISKKIRERASAFAGGSNKTRGSYKYLIIKAYNIRSRYIHGDVINLDKIEMLKISKSLDDLTRIILNKMINTPDNQIFTTIDSPENKVQFEEFFDKLVQKTSEDDSKNNPSEFLNKCVINAFTFR